MNDSDTEKLQIDLDRLGEWAEENVMKINPGKSKAVSFTRARVKEPLKYCKVFSRRQNVLLVVRSRSSNNSNK
jgi:hypothetical protein